MRNDSNAPRRARASQRKAGLIAGAREGDCGFDRWFGVNRSGDLIEFLSCAGWWHNQRDARGSS